jgi:hypothetical protein
MSRLTGNEVKSLMEAYSEVYVSQELTEEQVWEEVENWVNSLLEEGHDLSDYTWEEMYDAYIEEQGPRSSRGVKDPAVQARLRGIGNTLLYGNAAGKKPEAPVTRNRNVRGGGTIKPPAAAAPAKPAPTPAARPAAKPAPTPAARPAAKPAPTPAAKPAAKPAPTPTSTPKPTTPTASPVAKKPSLASQAAGIRSMTAASQARQSAPAPQLSARAQALKSGGPQGGARARMLNQDLDLFDVIKGYLLDEGYADSEKSALVIMANMSEEWKQSIVEGDALRNTIKTLEGKRDAMNANKPGSANTASPGKQSVGAATYKAYQRLRGV